MLSNPTGIKIPSYFNFSDVSFTVISGDQSASDIDLQSAIILFHATWSSPSILRLRMIMNKINALKPGTTKIFMSIWIICQLKQSYNCLDKLVMDMAKPYIIRMA